MILFQTKNAGGIFRLMLFIMLFIGVSSASATPPRPYKTVICIMENHGYPQIIGASAAPYITSLSAMGANLQEYYALTHPSQPNYIMMFCGTAHGVADDAMPSGTPWTDENLGASLLQNGFSFGGYSEDLPSIGSNVASSGNYARKHNPWVNWQGNGVNQIPATCNMPFTHFPSDFNSLPDVSFVIPNQNNDMHNGSDPARIAQGDAWVYANLDAYVNWAMNNNSLLILTFDEDNNAYQNRIPCIFVGPMVQPGNYAVNGYHHYDMLRTLEEMYGLPYVGNSAGSEPINDIWYSSTSANTGISKDISASIYPNPVTEQALIRINGLTTSGSLILELSDLSGRVVRSEIVACPVPQSGIPFRKEELKAGIYLLRARTPEGLLFCNKLIIN